MPPILDGRTTENDHEFSEHPPMPQVVGCSDGFEWFDSVEAVAEVVLFDFEVVADLEVEPEPIGGAEVAGEP